MLLPLNPGVCIVCTSRSTCKILCSFKTSCLKSKTVPRLCKGRNGCGSSMHWAIASTHRQSMVPRKSRVPGRRYQIPKGVVWFQLINKDAGTCQIVCIRLKDFMALFSNPLASDWTFWIHCILEYCYPLTYYDFHQIFRALTSASFTSRSIANNCYSMAYFLFNCHSILTFFFIIIIMFFLLNELDLYDDRLQSWLPPSWRPAWSWANFKIF